MHGETNRRADPTNLSRYIAHLREQERSAATIQKYARDLHELMNALDSVPLKIQRQVFLDESKKLTRAE